MKKIADKYYCSLWIITQKTFFLFLVSSTSFSVSILPSLKKYNNNNNNNNPKN